MTLSNLASGAVGALAMALGFFVLMWRVNVLQIGVIRMDYIAFHVALGAGCMTSGWMLLTGTAHLEIPHLALVVATLAVLRVQRDQTGQRHRWAPPASRRTDFSALDGIEDH